MGPEPASGCWRSTRPTPTRASTAACSIPGRARSGAPSTTCGRRCRVSGDVRSRSLARAVGRIRARVRAMTSPVEPEDLLSALVANADDAVIVADAEGAIRYWNRAAERMFGHPRDQAIGRSLDLIIPDKLRGRHWDGYTRVMATGETEYAGRMLAVPALRADGER